MVNYAVINNGIVVNIVAANAVTAQSSGWIEATGAKIGDTWDGQGFTSPPPPAPTSQDVNAERDRRMYSTFTFEGVVYACDNLSMGRITGAATLGGFAAGAGSPVGNLRWHGGSVDFAWIAVDKSQTPMDAQTSFTFGHAAAVNHSTHIFAGAALKAMNPIPQDYATNESYWS
jgi:hypothetical protein